MRKFAVATGVLALVPFLFGGAGAGEGGTITGKVVWRGAVPERKSMQVTKDNAQCECNPDGSKSGVKLDESLVVDAGTQGVAHSVAWVKGLAGGPVLGPATIDQKGCVFVPHVALITVGQKVKVLNPDKIAHNYHWWSSKNPPENKSIPKFKAEVEVPEGGFQQAEFIKVTCDVHPWMVSWIAVMENGYASVSDAKGGFRIEGVPPGKHKVGLWHEPASADGKPFLMEQEVTVEAGKTADVTFTLAP